ncbi:MAG: DUF3891 family protein [Acidobacteriia bacterium]|nr:DUF3891 family protein [Terriglobia bacterium]
MVLYPLNSLPENHAQGHPTAPISAWDAVLGTQRQAASDWWLVAQPDHAALAGDLAARIRSPQFPPLDADVVQAIALHDEGWAAFDRAPNLNGRGRPLSFFEMALKDFLRAWTDSIERARQESAIGGILVSEHFCRLGRWRLQSVEDTPEDGAAVHDFLEREAERQQQLSRRQNRGLEEILVLVDVLQFCDLLSLYLCCGARDAVKFPQKFNGQTVCMQRDGELYRTDPPLFGGGVSLAVRARRYPSSQVSSATTLPLLLG